MPGEGRKILIVEDDFYIRELYQRQFAQAGYAVEVAGSADEGIEKAKAGHQDVVLLDLMMPGKSGFDALKMIKADETLVNTKVIILTNLGQEDIIKEGFKQAADGYLIKSSHTPSEIVKEVENYFT